MKWTLLAAMAAWSLPAGAQVQPAQYPGQYYDGYRERYNAPPPGYYEPPPPRYYEPPPPRRALGERCEATIPSGYGSRPLICPIVRPRPVGRPCVCPAPPRFGGGSYEGRVIF